MNLRSYFCPLCDELPGPTPQEIILDNILSSLLAAKQQAEKLLKKVGKIFLNTEKKVERFANKVLDVAEEIGSVTSVVDRYIIKKIEKRIFSALTPKNNNNTNKFKRQIKKNIIWNEPINILNTTELIFSSINNGTEDTMNLVDNVTSIMKEYNYSSIENVAASA